MPKTTKNNAQYAEDLAKTAQLYLRGWTQAEIAREFNMTQQGVSLRVVKIIEMWRKSAIKDISDLKHRELEKINALEREYWESWEKSLSDFKETTQTTGIDLIGDPVDKMVEKKRKQTGDAVYLEGIRKCIELRCKILGVEAADKLDVNLMVDQPIAVVKMDMNQL